jgi:UDPglucose--hexose-1-phosphate uridylyltransferase
MQLRRDPITQSWVNLEDEGESLARSGDAPCPFCPGHEALSPQTLYEYPGGGSSWQVRVTPHLRPVYRIEGDPQRRAEGIYDKMRSLGAHEVVVEHPSHHMQLSRQTDENVAQVLRAYIARMKDLKKDRRFRYVTVFRNQGALAGEEFEHPHSEITATPFIPRRVGYELRSSLRYFELKERCLTCDIAGQEIAQNTRIVEQLDPFVAFCPFAARVPYETWLLSLRHHCSFEEDLISWDEQLRFARLLKSVLMRLEAVAPTHHLVLHSSPNLGAKFERGGIWKTLPDDYHWHLEILPVIASKAKSYALKEVYYNSLLPEVAAQALRNAPTSK